MRPDQIKINRFKLPSRSQRHQSALGQRIAHQKSFHQRDTKSLFGRADHRRERGMEAFDQVVDALELRGLLRRRPGSLSGGGMYG